MLTRSLNARIGTLVMALCLAPADSRAGSGREKGTVAEIVTFRLVPGTDEAAFLAAAQATAAPLAAQPGFLRRNLSLDEAGLWTDYVEWSDLASAQSAAEKVMADPAFGPFGAMISPEGLSMRHAPILWRMED